MNSRIQELRTKADSYTEDEIELSSDYHVDFMAIRDQKLLDLILADCIKIIKESALPDPTSGPVNYFHIFQYRLLLYSLVEKIEQHFQTKHLN